MTMLILVVIVLLAVFVVGAIAVAVALTRSSRRVQANDGAALELYPGHDTSEVPSSWARGHDPEARLHRRMRDSLSALRRSPDFDATYLDTRVQLELAAADLDRRLIATAPLRTQQKQEFLTAADAAVQSLESVVSTMLTGRAPVPAELDVALKRLQA